MLLWNWIAFFLRAFVAALFITYACNKLLNLSKFAATIRRHRLIPDVLSGIAAKILSMVELTLGLLFLFNVFPLIVGLAISILLMAFNSILLRARFTPGLNIQDCGCSGASNRKTPIGKALFRNALLISAIVVTMVVVGMHKNTSLSLSPLIEGILLVCILAGMLYIRSGLFSSLLNRLNVETVNRGENTVTRIGGNRRSFIKWSIAGFIGLGTFLNMAPLASAASVNECQSGASCGCNSSSYTWNKCYNGGDSALEYETTTVECCDKWGDPCKSTTTELGWVNCGGC